MANIESMRVIVHKEFIEKATGVLEDLSDAASAAVVIRAKARCPVKSGHLRDSIDRIKLPDGGYAVGSPARYASNVEYGTSRQRAQPFLRPALDSLKSNPPRIDPA